MSPSLIALALFAQAPSPDRVDQLSTEVSRLQEQLEAEQGRMNALSDVVDRERAQAQAREVDRLARVSAFGQALDQLGELGPALSMGNEDAARPLPALAERLDGLGRASPPAEAREASQAREAVDAMRGWIDQRDFARAREEAAVAARHLAQAKAIAEAVP